MKEYIDCITDALEKYKSHEKRLGYPDTFFTQFRHSFKQSQEHEDLIKNVKSAKTSEDKKAIIKTFLETGTLNNHSFRTYLLDELSQNFPQENWDQLNPKQLVFYQGIVFRGTLQKPKDAFENGMKTSPKANPDIEAYAHDTNGGVGISTSKSPCAAQKFQHLVMCDGRGAPLVQKGYLYMINYRGEFGIDIGKTLEARGHHITQTIASHKLEVNIAGNISPEDIKGVYSYEDGNLKLTDQNPNYNEDKKPTASDATRVSRLKQLYSPSTSR